jgi:hypothetical protein
MLQGIGVICALLAVSFVSPTLALILLVLCALQVVAKVAWSVNRWMQNLCLAVLLSAACCAPAHATYYQPPAIDETQEYTKTVPQRGSDMPPVTQTWNLSMLMSTEKSWERLQQRWANTQTIHEQLMTKFPFSLITDVKNAVQGLVGGSAGLQLRFEIPVFSGFGGGGSQTSGAWNPMVIEPPAGAMTYINAARQILRFFLFLFGAWWIMKF